MHHIVAATRSSGATPTQTLSRVLQILRDMGVIDFMDGKGAYRIVVDLGEAMRLLESLGAKDASLGEKMIARILRSFGVHFDREVSFKDARAKGRLRYDFRFDIGARKYAIEFDGKQHGIAVNFYGGIPQMIATNIRDKIKNAYSKENDITLVRIKSLDYKRAESKILELVIDKEPIKVPQVDYNLDLLFEVNLC